MIRFQNFLRRVFLRNATLKAIAFILTLALFIWVREDREAVVTGYAPVRLVIPQDKVVVSESNERVQVTVRGRWSDLRNFDPTKLRVTLQLPEDHEAGIVPITTDMVRVPPGLRVTGIQPNGVRVILQDRATKRVPIRPKIISQPPDSYLVGEVRVEPEAIKITGPASAVADIQSVSTEPLDVSNRIETFTERVQLRLDDPLVSYNLDQPIVVTVPIETQEVVRTIQGVPVIAINTSAPTTIRPSSLNLTLRGPKGLVDKLSADTIHAYVDMGPEADEPGGGTYSKQPRIKNVPADVNLVTYHPQDFLVTVHRADTPEGNSN